MKIVIPSYNRSNIIMSKTIALLERLDVPMNIIYVFVIEEEICSYKNILPNSINLIAGPLGLHNMRNFITNYFDEGQELLCMDGKNSLC